MLADDEVALEDDRLCKIKFPIKSCFKIRKTDTYITLRNSMNLKFEGSAKTNLMQSGVSSKTIENVSVAYLNFIIIFLSFYAPF